MTRGQVEYLDEPDVLETEMSPTEEGCDRRLFNKIAKTDRGLIMYQVFSHQYVDDLLHGLLSMKRETPCWETCPWLLWNNNLESRLYIQHGFNAEHVTYSELWWTGTSGRWMYVVQHIREWVKRVHEHLEHVQDDSREYDWFSPAPFPRPESTVFDESPGSFASSLANERGLP